MSLYPGYRPRGVRSSWDHCSMGTGSTGSLVRSFETFSDWPDPVDAVAWFDGPDGVRLRVLVADFPNGKRVTLRQSARQWSLSTEPRP